ncbi:MAG: ribulose-phosphate 3-epimerase [Anaerolineae bacterium]|nr:ribulose-phosphate 3-epimerase [Anaerolineae bacterium]
MKTYQIAASILSSDLAHLGDQLDLLETAGVDWIHVDVMDGMFVPNITFGPLIVDACRKSSPLPIDVHLMIEKPERYIDQFAVAGANSISVHIEGNPNTYRTIQAIKQHDCKAGIVLNPSTSIHALDSILYDADYVLVMSVNPGYAGQSFIASSVKKIAALKELMSNINCDVPIQVDGGINKDNIKMVKDSGASIFVAASAIFNHPEGVRSGVQALQEALI